ncbi:MAG: EamA family transporter [Meiothermus sp.]|nr:EamA family transporter [Meiothermus sp.]
MHRGHLLGIVYLSFATFLWGSTFVLVKGSLDSIGASQMNVLRFGLAVLCFLPWLFVRDSRLWRAGLELGAYLFVAYLTQTVGLESTTASRSAFITTLYVVILPLMLGILGHRLGWNIWASAGLAILGVGLLSYDGSPPNAGDLWTLGTAASYALYIWRMEHHAPRFAALPLTGVQMLVVLAGSLVWVGVEQPQWDWGGLPWPQILYLGVVASAFCVWLQAVGQRTVPASEAAVIYTLEPVYAALLAMAFLGERLGWQGWLGGALILGATLVSQLPLLWPRGLKLGRRS